MATGQLQPPICTIHLTETTEKFCRTCTSLVCSACLMSGDHNSHRIIDFQEFFTKQQKMVRKQLEQVKQIQQSESEIQEQLESIKSQTTKEYKDNMQTITTFVADFDNGMDEWAEREAKILKEKKALQMKQLESVLTKIESIEGESEDVTMVEKVKTEVDAVQYLTKIPQIDIERSKIQNTINCFMPKRFQISASISDSLLSDKEGLQDKLPLLPTFTDSKFSSSLPANLPMESPHSRTSSIGAMSFFSVRTIDTTDTRTCTHTTSTVFNYFNAQKIDQRPGSPSNLQSVGEAPAIMPPPSHEIPIYSAEPMAVIKNSTLKTSLDDVVSVCDICTSDSGDIIASDPVSKCLRIIPFSESPTNNHATMVKCGKHEPSIVSYNNHNKRVLLLDRQSGNICDLKPPSNAIQTLPCSDIVPGGIAFGRSTDGKLRTLVTNLKDSSVVILNSQGRVRGRIDLAPMNIKPFGIVFCPNSFAVIVTDLKQRCLHKITLRGDECWGTGQPARREGIMAQPSGVAVLPNGAIAVTDAKNHCITIFSQTGDLLSHIGGPEAGSERASFHTPTGIAYCSKRNSLLVLDSENRRIKVLSLQSSVVRHAIGFHETS